MKKPILVVVVLIALAALGLPLLLGGMTQSNFETHIAELDENPAVAMRIADYSRGWFSSRAQVEVSLDESYVDLLSAQDAADDPADAEFADMLSGQHIGIAVDIWHGPVIFANGLYFGLSRLHARLDDSDPLIATVTQEFGMPYLAELHGRVSYGGTFSFESNVPPIEYIDESGQISFTGLNVDGSLRGANLLVDAASDRLMIDVAGSAATFENMRANTASMRINDVLWIGDFDAAVEQVALVDTLTGAGSVSIAGIRFDGETRLDDTGELMEARVTYAVDSVSAPREELELADAELTIALGNLSVAAVTRYYEMMLEADMQNPAAAMMALPEILDELIAHDPAIAFDPLRFTLNGESLEASLSLRTVGGAQAGFDLMNPMMLLGMLEASAELTAAKPLVEQLATQATMAQLATLEESQLPSDQDVESMAEAQTQFMIATFLGQGYLLDDGENYTTEIEYANGEVRVNGTPLPLGALLQ